jgi:transcriptional regulator with XRE-family HTH domain
MEEIYTLIGKRIREERKKLHITQERLAELTELSVAFIGQIERGHNRASLVTIQKIADAMHLPVSTFFDEISAVPKTKYQLHNQIMMLLKNKPAKDQQFAKDLIEFVLKKK